MNKGLIALISFAAGGAAGYFLAKKMNDQDVEQRIQEEVESVKSVLKREAERKEPLKKREPPKTPEEVKKDAEEARQKYSGADTDGDKTVEQPARRAYRPETRTEEQLHKMAEALKPRVIPPDELGDKYGSDNVINMTYFSDGVLCGDDNKPLSDVEIEQAVGKDFAKHFGEYEEDSVCVINDMVKAEYEILADERTYKQFLKEHPEMRLGQ